ncbi:MAG TPA: ankyrin repeat domain-containing protein, partial [Kofleriaceae bacterium]
MDGAKTAIVLARLPAGPLRDAYLDVERRGWTALMQAVQDGDEAAVARSIAEGADVDAIAEGADSALSLACTSGSEAIVTMLLAAGGDASVRARRDYTLLHLAAAHSPLSVMRRLVDAGAQIEAVGSDTPLAVAIECDRIEILEYLVTQQLPLTEPSDAFGLACERGRLAAMRLMWDRFGAAVWSRGSPTALMRAARGGNPQAVRFLIDLGVYIDEFDLKEDLSPLMHAATNGHYDAAKALLDGGANAKCQTEWFVTAMRIAERRADGPMIELLRAHGAESTNAPKLHVTMPYAVYSTAVPRSPPRTTLEDALATDDVAALAQLDLEYTTEMLRTAARADAPHCVAYLLTCGADPHAGKPSALAHAVGACDARAVRMMLAARPTMLERTIAYAATDQSDPW